MKQSVMSTSDHTPQHSNNGAPTAKRQVAFVPNKSPRASSNTNNRRIEEEEKVPILLNNDKEEDMGRKTHNARVVTSVDLLDPREEEKYAPPALTGNLALSDEPDFGVSPLIASEKSDVKVDVAE